MLIPQGMWAQGAMLTGTLRIGGDTDLSRYGVTVSYDETTNTLSLNGATVLDAIENDHTSISTLTVVFSGTNTINTSSGYLGPCISGSGSIVFKASSPDAVLTLQSKTGYTPVAGFTNQNSVSPQNYNAKWIDSNDPTQATVEAIYLRVGDILVSNSSLGVASSISLTGSCITSGSVNYDNTNHTLTLTNAAITYDSPTVGETGIIEFTAGAIYHDFSDLKINLVGSNTLDCVNGEAFNGPTTITTSSTSSGSLTITSNYSGFTTSYAYSGMTSIDNTSGLHEYTATGTGGAPSEVAFATSDPEYNLWIGSLPVTLTNKNNVFTTGTNAGKVSYVHDAANNTGTLTLDGAQISGAISTTMTNLTIKFTGTGWIASSDNCIRSTANTGTLKFEKVNDGDKLELNSTSNVSVIKGFANLDGVPLETQEPYEIYTDPGTYGYPRTKQTLKTDTAGTNYAIVSATAVYPLWLSSKQVTSANASNISGWASFESATNTLTLTGLISDVTGSPGEPYYGVTTGIDDLKIKLVALVGDRNIIKCREVDDYAFKGYGNASTITFVPDASNPGSLIMDVTNSDGAHWFDGVTPSYQGTLALHDEGYDGSTFYVSRIAPVTNYDLWIDGTQVTSLNAGTITSGVSYDEVENELTLDNTNTVAVKTGLADLKVKLLRHVYFYSGSKSVFEGVNGTEKLTFTTDPTTPGYYDIDAANGIFKNISTANVTYQNDLRYWKMNATYDKAQIRQSPWEGQGTSNAPFHISNTTDLTTLADYVNNGYIIEDYFDLNVVDDLDCSPLTSFSSIGKRVDNYTIYSFDGTFDGKGRKIKNLTSPYGLFAHVGGSGIITDLTLENCIVNGVLSGVGATSTNPAESAGGVVAEFRSTGKIEKCHVVGGSVSGGSNDKIYFVGGIVGVLNSGTIDQCTVENVTISEPDASRTVRQSVGGIVGTSDGGAISNCSVTINNGTSKITNFTTTAPEVYAGAIIGEGRSKVTLTNNTYSSGVEVQTQKGPAPDDAKSGNIQRGTGEADSESNWDVFTSDGAVLAGVQKVKLTVDSKGTGSISGYYRVNSNEYYSLPSCSLVVRGTPNADYDLPLLTLKRDNGVALQVFYPDNTIQGTGYVDWSFNMPNSEVEADVKFGFDLSNANRIFTIDPITYNSTSAASITTIKTKATSTSTNEFTLTVSNDFTITGYQDENGAALSGAPSDVGNYNMVVSGTGYNSGTATIPFKITPQTTSISATDQKVTYDGTVQNYTNATGSGSFVVTYYTSEDDRTNNKNALTSAPTNANTYYVKVSQGDNNYSSADALATFKIDPLTATLNWTNTTFTYDGSAHVPTATVTNLIGTDACNVTVTGTETNASATAYTATATALSNTNYALPTAVTKDFTIAPAVATLSWTNTSFTYDGNAHAPTATVTNLIGTDACTVTVAGAETDASASLYTATATALSNTNYTLPASVTQTFTIAPLTATLSWGNTTFVYNGTAQAPTATVTNLVGTDVCNVTVGGAEIAAGSYTATATALSNANYQLPASPTTTFTILDRTATIDFGDRTFKTYYDANETFIVPDGTTAYIVTGVSGNAVTIQKVSYIKAGVPVLLESTPGSTVAKNVSETFTGNLLKYAAAATPATEKHYLLYKNEFVRASGTISNKVYLDLAGYSGGARSLVIGDGATAIEGIVIDEEDGDAKWYDMQGRRINKPTKAGLYIKDGQKVVVKTRY